jgi:FMN phosphatase YigB (HAD superfamily)
MVLLVFDLDNTLLSFDYNKFLISETIFDQRNSTEFLYKKHIPIDEPLIELMKNNEYPKFIASNAEKIHVTASIKALGIYNCFQDIQYRVTHLKPFPYYYDLTETMLKTYCRKSNIEFSNERIIFFDDLLENHIVPKNKKWITVWITQIRPNDKPDHIDYIYPSIHSALQDVNQGRLENISKS